MRERVFSGIQATGKPTIGNYSVTRKWPELSEKYDCIYCVVDLHAITITREPEALRRETREMFAILLALGIDPKRDTLFIQSHVPAHSELAWILGCSAMFGELTRMHQFKDKSIRHSDNINAGLFTYPVLMAADILLYNAKCVPVGSDQKQHVEIARDICIRFNGKFGETFVVPEPMISEVGARIMSLADPTKKMSKSDPNENATVFIMDSKDIIIKKLKRAVTDSDACVRYDPEKKPGVANLMTLYNVATGKGFEEIEKEFEGQGYGVFKPAVAEALDACLAPVRNRAAEYLSDTERLDARIREGAEKANAIAAEAMKRVHNAVGFYHA